MELFETKECSGKNIRLMKHMYEASKTRVRCAAAEMGVFQLQLNSRLIINGLEWNVAAKHVDLKTTTSIKVNKKNL